MSKHHALIDNFEAGGQKLRMAVTGLTQAEIVTRPDPGKWSIQQLVIHLADSDAIATDRMKRVIAEDNPTFLRADEQAYIDRLHCDAQSLADAVTLFDLNRRQFSRVLRELDDVEFERVGIHNSDLSEITLSELIKTYSDHLAHHLKFLESKLSRMRDTDH